MQKESWRTFAEGDERKEETEKSALNQFVPKGSGENVLKGQGVVYLPLVQQPLRIPGRIRNAIGAKEEAQETGSGVGETQKNPRLT